MDRPSECPKCGGPRAAAEEKGACPSCGLLFSRWPSYDDAAVSEPALEAAFATLEAAWADPLAHDRFLAFARSMDGLDLAAGKYRRYLRSHPDDFLARRGIERAVQIVSTLESGGQRGELLAGVRMLQILGFAVAAFLLGAVGLMAYGVLRR